MLDTAINALIILTALPAILSVVVYARVSWWRTSLGRHFMIFTGVLAILLIMVGVRRIFLDNHTFLVATLVMFSLMGATLWWRLALLVKYTRGGRAAFEKRRVDDVDRGNGDL